MASAPSALLVVTTAQVSNPEAIARLKTELGSYDVHQQLLERLSEHAVTLPANKFEKVHITGGELSGDEAEALFKSLKENGTLDGQISASSQHHLVLAGFVRTTDMGSRSTVWLKRAISNAPAPIKLKRSAGSQKPKAAPMFRRAPEPSPMTPPRESFEEDDLIDEDDLLGDSTLADTIQFPARCAPGPGKKRRRACKDCTCGMKELEEEEDRLQRERQSAAVILNSEDMAEIDFTVPGKAVGGCGSCALGDAFRCDGCPYLGLPPFKPGEVVSIDQFGDDF